MASALVSPPADVGSETRLNLTRLPVDILRLIVHHFQDSKVLPGGVFSWKEPSLPRNVANRTVSRHTVASLRLTSRALNEVAAPLLLPQLDVDLDQESLDRIDAISRNPLLARGVHAVCVNLAYRPFVRDFPSFVESRKADLGFLQRCCYFLEGPQRGITATFLSIKEAWDLETNNPDTSPSADRQPDSDSGLTLRQLYDKYSLKHYEQLRLLTSGSFLATLVRSLSRMTCLSCLHIWDRPRNGSPWGTNPKLALTSLNGHSAWLALGLPWHRVEDSIDPGTRALPPARLLTDLPIALHNAGVTLRQVKIDCLPYLPSNIALLDPGISDPASPSASTAWRGDLQAAFRSVEYVFVFSGFQRVCVPQPLPSDEYTNVDHYLSTLTCSPSLRSATLFLDKLTRRDGHETIRHPLGRVLSSLTSPRLEDLSVSSGSLHQDELDAFCRRLSPALMCFEMIDVELLSGSWRPAIRVLWNMARTKSEYKLVLQRLTQPEGEVEAVYLIVTDEWGK